MWCGANALGHRGTVASEVSSAPHQVESESVLAPAEQPFSSVLPHTWDPPRIRNFWGAVCTPSDGVLPHRGAQKGYFEFALSFRLTPHLLLSDGQTSANSCHRYGLQMSGCSYRLLVNFSFSPAKLSFHASSWGHPSNNMTQDKNPPFFPCCHTVFLCVVEGGKPSKNILPCFWVFQRKCRRLLSLIWPFPQPWFVLELYGAGMYQSLTWSLRSFKNEHFHGL